MKREKVSRTDVAAFLESLGVDPDQPCRIDVDTAQITVTPAEGKAATVRVVADPAPDGMVRLRHPALDREADVPASAAGQWANAGWVPATDEPGPGKPDRKQPEPTPGDDTPPRRSRKAPAAKESD